MQRGHYSIDPDEIFIDASNLPGLDASQFEGRVEKPISYAALVGIGILFCIAVISFSFRAYTIGVVEGSTYAEISRANRLDRSVLFATRGSIFDRKGVELAWNETATSSLESGIETYSERKYTDRKGFSHILGFVRYPKADAKGKWWREEYVPVTGVEYSYDASLKGHNGSRMEESTARGEVVRTNIVTSSKSGLPLHLSIDADVQHKLYTLLLDHSNKQGFKGGASVIMDVATGELLALTSFPEYDNAAFARGDTQTIQAANASERTPSLNRAVAGAYTPGSIIKPLFALAALQENIISPEKEIFSSGALVLPNPYNPSQPSIFKDWRAHGWVDMRAAIAQSSDEYFYTIGGGFGGQKGLGITLLDSYSKLFGLATTSGIKLGGEVSGTIPTPEWKEEVFGKDDPWRIGNTYHTSIGQFGFLVTPLQMVRYTAALANNGTLLTPRLIHGEEPNIIQLPITTDHYHVIHEGMRQAVTSSLGTAKALNIPGIAIAGKTGTAQLGRRNEAMNSWVVGYWPYESPRYAFATLMENAPAGTLSGASPAMKPFFEWLIAEKPEYVTIQTHSQKPL